MAPPRQTDILLVTSVDKTEEAFRRLLSSYRGAALRVVRRADEARRELSGAECAVAVIDTPLPDDSGLQLAEDLSRFDTTGVLLLLRRERYEVLAAREAQAGILTLPKPLDDDAVRQALCLLFAMAEKLRALETRAETLQAKMDDIRVVNRAKLLLVQKLGMSEQEAHKFLEKTAMDRCVKRREVAESIIRTYEN